MPCCGASTCACCSAVFLFLGRFNHCAAAVHAGDMPISEVGMTSPGEVSAGSGWEALPLRNVPTEIDPGAVAATPVGTLVIRVKDLAGEHTYFKLNTTTRMAKVFNAFAVRKGVPQERLRFLLDGQRVNEDDTPITLELEDQDQIDCFLEQPYRGPCNPFIIACLQALMTSSERNETPHRATAAPAGRVEGHEGLAQTESDPRREVLEGSVTMPTSVRTVLEELRERTLGLERAQSKLERQMRMGFLISMLLPLAMLIATSTRGWYQDRQ